MLKFLNKNIVLTLMPLVLVFIFVYPRVLIHVLGKSNPWTSFFYMYGLGSVTFVLGLFIAIRTKSCNLSVYHDRRIFFALTFGLILLMSLHAFWIYLAISLPYKGLP